MILPNDLILFQGDSITNAFRKPEERNLAYRMGAGYALLIAAHLGLTRPGDQLRFENRGVSGQGVAALEARWDVDCLDLSPNVVSILVGVNDAERGEAGEGLISPHAYHIHYRTLLERTRASCPGVRFVLCEPFLLPCELGNPQRMARLCPLQASVRQLAREFDAVFVPLQSRFDAALTEAPASYWAYDGIHPTAAGFGLIARCWLEAVECISEPVSSLEEAALLS